MSLSHGFHSDEPGGHPGSDAMAARALERAAAGKSLYVPDPQQFPSLTTLYLLPQPWPWQIPVVR